VIGAAAAVGLIGLILVAIGVVTWLAPTDGGVRKMLRTLPITRISDFRGGGVAHIRGTVVPTPEGALCAPASLREVVRFWARITESDSGDHTHFEAHAERRPFFVDDGSGEMALVRPDPAVLVVVPDVYGTLSSHVTPAPRIVSERLTDHQLAYVQQRIGRRPIDPCYIREESIAVGDQVTVIGLAERTAGVAYRTGANTLLLYDGGTGQQSLMISNLQDHEIEHRVRTMKRIPLVLAGVGFLLCAACAGFLAFVL
jgi:hypothetical protein